MKIIRHLLEYCIVSCFIVIMRFLGMDFASNLCGKLGRVLGPLLPITNIARNNIKRAFPDMLEHDVKHITTKMWDNLSRTVAELPNISNLKNENFYSRVTIIGQENLEKVRNSGKSCIIITGHFANWELVPKIVCDAGLKFSFIYREANNKLVDTQITKLRQNANLIQIPKGKKGARNIIKAFRDNRCVGILADQKLNTGIEVPFYGFKAMTASAPAKLALDYNCPIIPLQVIRKKGATFTIIIHDPIHINHDQNNSAEIYRIMREINYIYEQWIKKYPEQWFWLHKRWPKNYY